MLLRKQSKLYYNIYLSGLFLVVLGIVMVLSSSSGYAITENQNPLIYLSKHLLGLFLGGIVLAFFWRLGIERVKKFITPLFIISVILLLIPVLTGNLRWIRIGFLSFQPSELVKLTFLLYLARYLSKISQKGKIKNIKCLIIPVFSLSIITLLLQLQKDLGTFLIILFIFFVLFYIVGLPRRYLFSMGFAGIILFAILILIFPYRIERIKVFVNSILNPESVYTAKGYYQIRQSKMALSSGGIFGKGVGIGKGKLRFLPEAHKDYVFAVIGEETGFVGCMIIMFLFGLLIFSALELVTRLKDIFEKLIVAGIGTLITLQFLMHVYVVLNLIPSKGTTLPFFSAGSSSLFVNLIALGILLHIAKKRCGSDIFEEVET